MSALAPSWSVNTRLPVIVAGVRSGQLGRGLATTIVQNVLNCVSGL